MNKLLPIKLSMIFLFASLSLSVVYGSQNSDNQNAKNTSGIDSLNLKVMVPAYFYPSGNDYWARLDSEALKMPGRLWAIANPESGPGSQFDPVYQTAITKLQADSGYIIGYVHTSYGTRPIANVEADINSYYSFYPTINGIFIDEQANVTGYESYYAQLYNYIKQKDSTALVVTNPGADQISSYLFYNGKRIADVICTFENSNGFNSWVPPAWYKNYSRDNFYIITYNANANEYVNYANKAALSNVGWIYCTNDILPNPYDTLPFYFEDFCNYLITGIDSLSSGGQSLINIDGNFDDWSNVPFLNIYPNPSASVGDSPNPDADYVDFWATNDTSNLYLSYQVAGVLSSNYFYHIFIDTDNDSSTGYRYNDSTSIGAEFMIENNSLYKYSGTGGANWSWQPISGFNFAEDSNRTEMSMPLSELFTVVNTNTMRLIFQVNSAVSPYTLMEIDPSDYKNEFYKYTLHNSTTGVTRSNINKLDFQLNQNYPNPFNPSTNISYEIPQSGYVTLKIFNVLGQEVETIVDKEQSAGKYSIVFNSSGTGSEIASGIYFYQIRVGNYVETRKMVLIK